MHDDIYAQLDALSSRLYCCYQAALNMPGNGAHARRVCNEIAAAWDDIEQILEEQREMQDGKDAEAFGQLQKGRAESAAGYARNDR